MTVSTNVTVKAQSGEHCNVDPVSRVRAQVRLRKFSPCDEDLKQIRAGCKLSFCLMINTKTRI